MQHIDYVSHTEADASSRQTPSCEKRKQEEDTEHTEEEHGEVLYVVMQLTMH